MKTCSFLLSGSVFLLSSFEVIGGLVTAVDAVVPMDVGKVHVLGRPGALMDRSISERAFSRHARTTVYDEAVHAFETHWDDLVRNNGEPGWQNEYWGKTMLSYAGALAYTQDPELKKWLCEKAHDFVTRFQKPNGYLCTYQEEDLIGVRQPGRLQPKQNPVWNFSIWGRKYTLWALYDLYRVTGEREFLAAAVKMADHLVAQLKRLDVRIEFTGSWRGLSSMTILKPLCLLARETGNEAYTDLARRIFNANDVSDPADRQDMNLVADALSSTPVVDWFGPEQRYFLTKAYELMSFYEGLVEYYRLTGEPRALQAAKTFREHLVAEELNPMRSAGYFDHFAGARCRWNGMSELCDVTHWIRLNRELYLVTGESKYLDSIEEAFYNAFLAGVSPDGRWGAHIIRSHGSRHLQAPAQTGMTYHQCCPDNMLRTFFDWASTVVGVTTDGAVSVNFYSDAVVDVPGGRIEIEGGYPVADVFRLKVQSDKPMRVRLRVPAWSPDFGLSGARVSGENGWYDFKVPAGMSSWSVAFDLSPRLLESPDPFDKKLVRDGEWYTNRFFEWYTPEMRGLERDRPAAQVMRGPLVLAKGRLGGNSREETLFDDTVDRQGWRATSLRHLPRMTSNASVWGSWMLTLERAGEQRHVPVADFWSVSAVNDPANWFSVWF